jgi:hypothetical protein
MVFGQEARTASLMFESRMSMPSPIDPKNQTKSRAGARATHEDPPPNDVLLGKGKPIQQMPGNVRCRKMIENRMEECDDGDRGVKCAVAASILHLLKEEGGQFLKEAEDGGWVEVDESTARLKTSHLFRSRRKVLQAALKKGKSTA